MKRTITLSIAALLLSASGLLLFDSLLSRLQPANPELGRPLGCYTTLENLFKIKQPDTLRGWEMGFGVCLTLTAATLAFFAFKRNTGTA